MTNLKIFLRSKLYWNCDTNHSCKKLSLSFTNLHTIQPISYSNVENINVPVITAHFPGRNNRFLEHVVGCTSSFIMSDSMTLLAVPDRPVFREHKYTGLPTKDEMLETIVWKQHFPFLLLRIPSNCKFVSFFVQLLKRLYDRMPKLILMSLFNSVRSSLQSHPVPGNPVYEITEKSGLSSLIKYKYSL